MTPEELFKNNYHYAEATVFKFLKSPHSIAKQKHMTIDDLFQIARMALWEACLDFQSKKGGKFITFAINNIKWRLMKYINKHPEGMKFTKFKEMKNYTHFISLDAPLLDDEDGRTNHEVFGEDYLFERDVIGKDMFTHIKSLVSERGMKILKERLKNKSYRDIGSELGLSREMVRLEIKKIGKQCREVGLV